MVKKLTGKIEGKYTEYLPDHLQERFERGLNDEELMHLQQEIALLDVRITSLVESLDRQVLSEEDILEDLIDTFPHMEEEDLEQFAKYMRDRMPENFVNHRTFKHLERLTEQYQNSINTGQVKKADQVLRTLFRLIYEGRRDGDVWDDIQNAMKQRRDLIKQEQDRQTKAAQLVTVDKVILLMEYTIAALREAVNKYVQDTEIRDFIFVEAETVYDGILTSGGSPQRNQIAMD